MAITVTAEDVRGWSLLDFDELGFVTGTPDPLDVEVERASDYVADVTGVEPDDLTDGTRAARKFQNAVQLRVEQIVIKRQPDFVSDLNEDALDISVTGYSQRRISYKESDPATMINPWKELNDLLLSMLTDDKLAYWQEMGRAPGGYSALEVVHYDQWFDDTEV